MTCAHVTPDPVPTPNRSARAGSRRNAPTVRLISPCRRPKSTIDRKSTRQRVGQVGDQLGGVVAGVDWVVGVPAVTRTGIVNARQRRGSFGGAS